jgi:hypothetical protein
MNLKHAAKGLLLLAIVMLSNGCPYESDVPLGPCNTARLDGTLFGRWELYDTPEDPIGAVSIYPFNEHEVLILLQEKGKEKIDLIRAFVTTIGKQRFLNLQDVSFVTKDRNWMFANYRIADDTLRIRVVDDKLLTRAFGSSAALRRVLRKNLHRKELYQDEEGLVLKRIQ